MNNNERRNSLGGFTASWLTNPFRKLKAPQRNIHTMRKEFPTDSDGVPNEKARKVGDGKSGGQSNVSRIMKLIPGLCQVTKIPPETSLGDGVDSVGGNAQCRLNETGFLIDVAPPAKKIISGKVASRKRNYLRSSQQRKKCSVDRNVIPPSQRPRLYIESICLNVKVSGPMYWLIEKMEESNIKKVITLSGAGMSTSAGIPDFRSPNSGIYNKVKEYDLPYAQAIFERKFFDKNPKPLFALLKEMLVENYKPTVAHYFVKLLEEKGLLLRHITQNVDGLERLAGISHNKVVEAHGSVYASRCMKCKTEYDLQWLRDRLVIQGKTIPQCQDPHCLGMVKPNIVLFGETLNPRFTASVKKDIPQCDLLIIMGTSLVVEPFASTAKKVSRECPRIIINNIPVGEHLGIAYEGSKEFERKRKKSALRDVFIQGSCDEGVLHLAKLLKWETDLEALINRCEPLSSLPRSSTPDNERGRLEKEMKESKIGTSPQINQDRKQKCLKSSDPVRRKDIPTDKDVEASVSSQAKNMWKRITSHVRRPQR